MGAGQRHVDLAGISIGVVAEGHRDDLVFVLGGVCRVGDDVGPCVLFDGRHEPTPCAALPVWNI